MAIFVSKEFQDVDMGVHGYFESSNLKATDVGNIWDALVRDENDKEIDVDNGVALAVGEYTGNGLQERYATIAKSEEPIAVTGAVVRFKTARTESDKVPTKFYTRAGQDVKTYEVVAGDVFAVGQHQFTSASQAEVKVGAYVAVDGEGQWVASATKPAAAFVGKIHSLSVADLDTITVVRILCVKNA